MDDKVMILKAELEKLYNRPLSPIEATGLVEIIDNYDYANIRAALELSIKNKQRAFMYFKTAVRVISDRDR